MKPVLIYLQPLDQATGARFDVRVGDGPSADTFGIGGVSWEPALAVRPVLSIELMSPDMDGRVQAGQARFTISLDQISTLPKTRRAYWKGAPVIIRSNGILEGTTAVADFVGYVTEASPDENNGQLSISATVSVALIDRDLLVREFDGGGGLGGDPEKRGVLLPVGLGTVKNIEPVWFDLTRNIGMLDGYSNGTGVSWCGEGLNSLGAPVGNYADYTALAAAIDSHAVLPGRWAYSCQAGKPTLVGLGAQPAGIITCHATFGYGKIGSLMRRIMSAHAYVPDDKVDVDAFAALDTLVPEAAHYWTADQRNVKDLLEALAQSCNATPLLTFQGKISVTRAVASDPVAILNRSGSTEPRVLDWQNAAVDPPFYVLKARTARPARVLTFDQINYVDTILDRGLYNNGTTYRAGNVVWLADNSQWLFIAVTPSAGHAPRDAGAGAYWQQLKPGTTADDVVYLDGGTLEDWKPAMPGADVTATVFPDVFHNAVGLLPAEVKTGLDINALAIIEQGFRQEDQHDIVEARTFVDGQEVALAFKTFRNEQQTFNSAVNSFLTLLGVKTPDGTAVVLNGATVMSDPTRTIAQQFYEVLAANAAVSGAVDHLDEVLITAAGAATARSVTEVKAGGSSGEIGIIAGLTETRADGTTKTYSSVAISAGKTYIIDKDTDEILALFDKEEGGVVVENLRVSRLTVNAAIVPNLVSQSVRVFGTSDPVYGADIPLEDTLPVSGCEIDIHVGAKGKVKLLAVVSQAFDAEVKGSWSMAFDVDGTILSGSWAYGHNILEHVTVRGVFNAPAAGTYTARLRFQAESHISISNRTLDGDGYVNTE